MLWSAARVSTWLKEYKGGKYAVLLQDDFFKNMDGNEMCTLPSAVPGIARNVLFAYMCTQQAFRQLSPAYTDGEHCGVGSSSVVSLTTPPIVLALVVGPSCHRRVW